MKKIVLSAVVFSVMSLWGCTEWNPLFDGFGGLGIAHDGGSMLDAGPALSGKCDAGTWNVCTGCNGEPEIQRCLDGNWQPCPCPPDMRAPVDMASLPDLGMVQDRQPAPDLAPGPDLAMECRPGEVQACVVCQGVGTHTCDMNGKWGACMPPKPVDCMNVGGTRPYMGLSCSTHMVQTCQPNCTWGAYHLDAVPDGCGPCDPIGGTAGCSGPGDTCQNVPKCTMTFTFGCTWLSDTKKESDACGRGGSDDCDIGLSCNVEDNRCRKVCLLSNPMCPQGRHCAPMQSMNKCWGFCVP